MVPRALPPSRPFQHWSLMPQPLHDNVSRSRNITDNVRAEMARRQMTQVGLAAVLGYNSKRLGRRLNGSISFTVDELIAIAAALGCTLSALVGD